MTTIVAKVTAKNPVCPVKRNKYCCSWYSIVFVRPYTEGDLAANV